jgi:hypothetical protein
MDDEARADNDKNAVSPPECPFTGWPFWNSDWSVFLLSRFSCGYPFSSFAGFLFSAIQHVSNCTSYPLISSSSSNINLASL